MESYTNMGAAATGKTGNSHACETAVWWDEWRRLFPSNPDGKLLQAVNGRRAWELAQKDKPPKWLKSWMYDALLDVFGMSPGLLIVWLVYLEWRHDLSATDRKYTLYKSERGVHQELVRLRGMADGDRVVAAELMATSMDRLWAGLPRPDWLRNTTRVSLPVARTRTAVGKESADEAWVRVIRSVTEDGVVPADMADKVDMSPDEINALAVAVMTGDSRFVELAKHDFVNAWEVADE